ncbi:hypothetical protein KC19_6G023500, partial [Ceratodon purpureus]
KKNFRSSKLIKQRTQTLSFQSKSQRRRAQSMRYFASSCSAISGQSAANTASHAMGIFSGGCDRCRSRNRSPSHHFSPTNWIQHVRQRIGSPGSCIHEGVTECVMSGSLLGDETLERQTGVTCSDFFLNFGDK